MKNKIGLQPCSLTDLPGSRNFVESQQIRNCIYGRQGTMDYLVSLCIADLTETNRQPPNSLHNSPLVVAYMAYDAIQQAGSTKTTLRNATYIFYRSWKHPTKNGRQSLRERFYDGLCSFASQLVVSQYKNHAESVAYSRDEVRGSFERLWEREENPEVRTMFAEFVEQFR